MNERSVFGVRSSVFSAAPAPPSRFNAEHRTPNTEPHLLPTMARALLAPPGWLAGALGNRWRDRGVFMFFATPNLGGAERVHAQIVEAVADRNPVVVFTEPPGDARLLPLYTPHCDPLMLHPRRRSRAREYFNEARMAAEINRAGKSPVVLGAFSHFFYRLLPRLRPGVRCVDLIHNFGVQFEHFSLPYVERLDARVVLSERIRADLAALYEAFTDTPASELAGRIRVIANGVPVPPDAPTKAEGPINVLYVGRATPEKRVHLVGQIAAELAARRVDARVAIVGDVGDVLRDSARHCRIEGVVTDAAKLSALYDAAHVLLLTSSREGLPMAMLEGMARGCVPVVPAVGAIVEQVNSTRGVLLDAEPEAELVRQAVDAIERLSKHRGALAAMGKAAHAHARDHCSDVAFRATWRELLIGAPGA